MRKVVIVSAVRTAIGSFQGKLSKIPTTQLGAIVIAEAVERAKLTGRAGCEKRINEGINEVIMGNVLPAGLGQNPARQAMLQAGLSVSVGAETINKVCGSGLMAVMLGARSIVSGDADIIVAGGMENMSLAPYYLLKARTGYRLGDEKLVDGMIYDGLRDAQTSCHMGDLAELVAEKYNITREDADIFTYNSYQRALITAAEGMFKEEIVPVNLGRDKIHFDKDEIPRKTSLVDLAELKPVFKENGQVTAGNASKISDGAAAFLLMSEKKAKKLRIKPMARIVAQDTTGIEPKDLLMAPVLGIQKILKKAGLKKEDIDLYEINEAFACSTVAVIKELGLDETKVNIRGGAVALGHPIGASGARVLVTLLYAMKERNAKRGLVSVCLGGGEAVSLIIER